MFFCVITKLGFLTDIIKRKMIPENQQGMIHHKEDSGLRGLSKKFVEFLHNFCI